MSASSSTLMMPAPSGVVRRKSATSNSGAPKKASASCCSSPTILRIMTPAVAVATPPYASISFLPMSLFRWLSSARRSARSTSGILRSSAYLKAMARTDSCVSFSSMTLASRIGPNEADRCPQPHAGLVAHQGEELAPGTARGAKSVRPSAPRRAVTRSSGVPGGTQPRDVALDVADEDGHAGGGQLLGHDLQALRLAGAGGAGHQSVAVQHGQRDAHPRRRVGGALALRGSELDCRPFEAVAGGDRVGEALGDRHPGGQVIARPPSRWRCRWKTLCPASAPTLVTIR